MLDIAENTLLKIRKTEELYNTCSHPWSLLLGRTIKPSGMQIVKANFAILYKENWRYQARPMNMLQLNSIVESWFAHWRDALNEASCWLAGLYYTCNSLDYAFCLLLSRDCRAASRWYRSCTVWFNAKKNIKHDFPSYCSIRIGEIGRTLDWCRTVHVLTITLVSICLASEIS